MVARSLCVLLGICLLIPLGSDRAGAQEPLSANSAERLTQLNLVDLEAQLVSGLRLTNAQQKQYIAAVLNAVRQQKLPRSMVNVVYVWSLRRNDRYPFPYFRIAMNTLAARRGVTLP